MNVESNTISDFVRNRDLVRIERDRIDGRTLQAFPLGFSDTVLAVLYVYDFHIDGILFLRRDTITDIRVNATATFQRQLLDDAGYITDDLFCLPHTIDSFASLLAGLAPNQITILEEESLDESGFWIGRYVWREDRTHWMHEFTGDGNWEDDLTELDLDAVTCCQLDTNYVRFYQRYFDSHGFPELPG
ncbi:hypothetical protein [Crateriforma spongiae]|uniref:hypothetical protein n=1 Tax=Crateriforma spongiae TaxID=2724528 RepID=UPI0039AFE562